MNIFNKVLLFISGLNRVDNVVAQVEKEQNMTKIIENNGRFTLVDRFGNTIRQYSRARDARRGAARLGLQVA